jgi:hypothetical protein
LEDHERILVLPGPSHSHSPRPLSTKLLSGGPFKSTIKDWAELYETKEMGSIWAVTNQLVAFMATSKDCECIYKGSFSLLCTPSQKKSKKTVGL